jgi:thioester reductase-like protein
VDCIVHNACYVNGVLPYPLLRDANVGGTLEAVRLAATVCRLRSLVSCLY